MTPVAPQPKRFALERECYGSAFGIVYDGWTILHLMVGTTRNEAEGGAEAVVRLLNQAQPEEIEAEMARMLDPLRSARKQRKGK